MLKGTGISDGIGLGKAIVFKSQKIKLEKNKIKDVTLEKEKFYKAIKEVEKEIENLLEKISGTEKEIMQAYLLILQDPNLIQKTIEIIEKEKWNAAYATEIGFNEIIKEFEKVDDPYISERSKDIEDMKKKIIAKIIGKEEIKLSKLPSNTILVAKELSIKELDQIDTDTVLVQGLSDLKKLDSLPDELSDKQVLELQAVIERKESTEYQRRKHVEHVKKQYSRQN